MNNLAAAGFGCIAALALWKGTKERLIPALLGMFVIAVTVKYADNNDDLSWLIYMAGYVIFVAGAYGLKRWDARVAQLDSGHILKPKPTKPTEPTLLWCSKGHKLNGHWMGPNEPYRFLSDDTTGNSGLVCITCVQRIESMTADDLIQEIKERVEDRNKVDD
jgi:hypothetical protein